MLAHLELVTIHPFLDGNGRLARLLMNFALVSAGYPWLTIRADEWLAYFRALERAQVEEDVRPLREFLPAHIREGVRTTSGSRKWRPAVE